MSHKIFCTKQRGSMLVMSLFVIIVMAMLGATMVKLLSSGSDSVVHEVYGLRALHAAQSAIEAKMVHAVPLTQNGASVCDDIVTTTYSATGGLQNCRAVTSCSLTTGFVGETTQYYHFVSTGICSAGKVVASRTLTIDAKVD